jgi:4-amino-4-deoxy-L-arabinose transferase-like glycosyltransferase
MPGAIEFWRRHPVLLAALAIASISLLRTGTTIVTPLELGPDEAQYWRWAQSLDWGYYSKPPLIAWAIGLSTSVFGDAEWAVRLPAACGHGLAAFLLFILGRNLFSLAVGAWAAAIYVTMPGVWLSSTIMSTDALLLPLWAAALVGLDRMRRRGDVTSGILFGAAAGLAMLAKYAALYVLVGAALAAVLDRSTRQALLSASGAAALAAFLAVLAPNLLWNAAHDFATVSHTSDNANWGAIAPDLWHLGRFIGDQLAVFGPIAFLLLAGVALARRHAVNDPAWLARARWLACFIIPPLVVIAIQAVVSRAHANWAASAYPAASVLLASLAIRLPWRRLLSLSILVNSAIGIFATLLAIAPTLADSIGAGSGLKRVRGWEQTAAELETLARRYGASALMVDEREVWHGVDYYGRDRDLPPLRAWRRLDEPRSHAEEAGAMSPGEDSRVLIASIHPDFLPFIRADFARIESVGSLSVPLGGGYDRRFSLYVAEGYNPVPRSSLTAPDIGPSDPD